jgi:hypothetical protein
MPLKVAETMLPFRNGKKRDFPLPVWTGLAAPPSARRRASVSKSSRGRKRNIVQGGIPPKVRLLQYLKNFVYLIEPKGKKTEALPIIKAHANVS